MTFRMIKYNSIGINVAHGMTRGHGPTIKLKQNVTI